MRRGVDHELLSTVEPPVGNRWTDGWGLLWERRDRRLFPRLQGTLNVGSAIVKQLDDGFGLSLGTYARHRRRCPLTGVRAGKRAGQVVLTGMARQSLAAGKKR
jgi:hypothetical protein